MLWYKLIETKSLNYDDDDVLTQKLIIFLENTQCGYLVILEALVEVILVF